MANVVLLFVLVRARERSAKRAHRQAAAPAHPPGTRNKASPDRHPQIRTRGLLAPPTPQPLPQPRSGRHPLMTQAVGYVSGRSEVLCALFLLASFLCLHAWLFGRGAPGGSWRESVLGAGARVEEVAVMLPVLLLA
jgi:hypothetical protein